MKVRFVAEAIILPQQNLKATRELKKRKKYGGSEY
jgi:hypothetical protein